MSAETMITVPVALAERSYDVQIGSGLLATLNQLPLKIRGSQVLIVSDDNVAPLYLDTVREQISARHVDSLVIAAGEAQKNPDNWLRILEKLMSMSASRDACLIALGGGVIGDITGFAAASYMRGIDFIQIPTTLLAQVDASVGGKTAINHSQGKNLIGAFHQPVQVIIDVDTLDTLPQREFRAGLAEVMKYGFIMDAGFIESLSDDMSRILSRDRDTLGSIIAQCCRHKAAVVAADETETGHRALLNLGHTFAHALETATGYEHYLHGEAVAIGCVLAAELSEMKGYIDARQVQLIRELVIAAGLPHEVAEHLDSGELINLMRLDKKNVSGNFRFILLHSPGDAHIDDSVNTDELERLFSRHG